MVQLKYSLSVANKRHPYSFLSGLFKYIPCEWFCKVNFGNWLLEVKNDYIFSDDIQTRRDNFMSQFFLLTDVLALGNIQ